MFPEFSQGKAGVAKSYLNFWTDEERKPQRPQQATLYSEVANPKH